MRISTDLKFNADNVRMVKALSRDCIKGSLAWDRKSNTGALVIRMSEDKLYRFNICETMKSFVDLQEVQKSSLNILYKLVK